MTVLIPLFTFLCGAVIVTLALVVSRVLELEKQAKSRFADVDKLLDTQKTKLKDVEKRQEDLNNKVQGFFLTRVK